MKIGFNTGNLWVDFCHTTPIPAYTITHGGWHPYHIVNNVVSNETHRCLHLHPPLEPHKISVHVNWCGPCVSWGVGRVVGWGLESCKVVIGKWCLWEGRTNQQKHHNKRYDNAGQVNPFLSNHCRHDNVTAIVYMLSLNMVRYWRCHNREVESTQRIENCSQVKLRF